MNTHDINYHYLHQKKYGPYSWLKVVVSKLLNRKFWGTTTGEQHYTTSGSGNFLASEIHLFLRQKKRRRNIHKNSKNTGWHLITPMTNALLAAWIYVSTWMTQNLLWLWIMWIHLRNVQVPWVHASVTHVPRCHTGGCNATINWNIFALVQMRRRGWLQLCWLRGTYLWLVPKERCLYSYLYLFMIKLSNNILMRHLLSCFVWVLPILAIVDVFLRKGSKKLPHVAARL